MALRLIFMGTPDFAVPTLSALLEAGHDIAAVYTRAPKPAGRGMKEQPTPVEREARMRGLEVRTPASLKNAEALDAFAALNADAAVVVAYGMILPKAILQTPRLTCFNVHASLLPRWRGAAPINRAIMAGDAESGVTIMQMDEGLDTGDMVSVERVAIDGNMTAGELHDALAPVGAKAMVRALADVATIKPVPQPTDGVTYAAKLTNAETRINWSKAAPEVHNHIRGLSPFPGAWCELDGLRLKVLRSTLADGGGAPGTLLDDRLTVACGTGAVRLLQVQPAGKRAMAADEFLRGTRVRSGTVLT